jgi:hypothetical protein
MQTDTVTKRLAALTEGVTERPWTHSTIVTPSRYADRAFATHAANNFEALVVALAQTCSDLDAILDDYNITTSYYANRLEAARAVLRFTSSRISRRRGQLA